MGEICISPNKKQDEEKKGYTNFFKHIGINTYSLLIV